MKKLFVLLFSLGLTVGAFAQHGHYSHRVYVRPRVVVGLGYSPFYYPYYDPFLYPYPPVYNSRPSRLEMKIEDIKADYKDRIWSARHDKSLSRQDRKQEIHSLKVERDQKIEDAKRDYYKTPSSY